MVYPIDVAGLQRELPLCRVTNDLYIGAFVIFGDVELTVHAAKKLLEKAPEYDYLISAEAKGIPLIYEMARQSGQNKYFLARKGPKLYMSGVFDVISTGESLAALEQLVTQAGGIIAGRMAILAEGDAQARDDLIYLQKLPVFNADGSIKE